MALAFLVAAAAPATAQTVVGGVSNPSVTVDLGVLDSLGPPRTLPDLLRGKPPERRAVAAPHSSHPAHRTAQHPPKAKKKAVAKAKPKHAAPAVAARKAAPVAPVAATAPAVPRESVASTPIAEPAAAPNPPAEAAAAPGTSHEAVPPPSTAAAAPAPAAATASAPAPAPPTPAPATPTVARAAATATVAPPSPVPTASPSPAAVTAMSTPPSVPPEAPIAPMPAAAPAAVAAAPGGPTRILFGAGAADLPDAAKPELDALVQRLAANDQTRLQLVAHASGAADEANESRRVSLQRALAVRSYLIEHGIASTRMDVRALGNRTDGGTGGALDRVDVIMLDR